MKKMAMILISCIIFLTACNAAKVVPGTSPSPAQTASPEASATPAQSPVAVMKASDFLPIVKDIHMKYKGSGNEYAQYETYVDIIKENIIQLRSMNGGTVSAIVYQLKNGAVVKVFQQGEVYYSHDFTAMTNQDDILIKDPIAKGNMWTLADGSKRTITDIAKQLKLPAGDFTAVEVTTDRKDSIQKDYYVKYTGLVKTEFTPKGSTDMITSELEKLEKGVPYKQKIKFYFPEFNKNNVTFVEREIDTYTNQDMRKIFEEQLKIIPANSGLSKTLTANTKILGYGIDEKQGAVIVDLSSDFIKEMNAGTTLESLLLNSIASTFGNYYQKDKVGLTVDGGKPYESGHVILQKGEYLNVEHNDVQYKP